MNTRNILIILAVLLVVFLGWRYFDANDGVNEQVLDTNSDGIIDERDVQNTEDPNVNDGTNNNGTGNNNGGSNNTGGNEPVALNDSVRLSSPRSGQTVGTPLVVKGEARGSWYFEASFPVKLYGPNGDLLAQAPAQAKGEWMTTNFVPFEATLSYVSNTSGTGKLVLEKDNPSGLPANDASVSIPVNIVKTNSMTVKAYFSKSGGNDCSVVQAVTRTVPQTQSVAQAALLQLLKGPTAAEASAGLTTSIPSGVQIKSIAIRNGVAYVDFTGALDEGVAGSCRVTAIRSQIEETLKQFSTVKSVVISINGETEDILQP